MRTGISEPVPVRRAATQVPALLQRLRRHRCPHPDPRPHNLPLRRQPERHHRLLVILAVPVHPAAHFGHPQRDPVVLEQRPSTRTGCRRTPARTPQSRSRPSPALDPQAALPEQRPAAGAPTAAHGTPRYRRTPPRSPRARRSASSPAAAAAPATSPDPASPRSRPARKTRTAATPGSAPRRGGWPAPPPRSRACPRPAASHRAAGASPSAPHTRPGHLPGTHIKGKGTISFHNPRMSAINPDCKKKRNLQPGSNNNLCRYSMTFTCIFITIPAGTAERPDGYDRTATPST